MSDYTPDSWKIIEINSEEHGKIYKVLASWYGGFVGGDSWKLSSGIEDVVKTDNLYTMPQSSGSTYLCYEGTEHVSGLIGQMFSTFVEQSEGWATVRMLDMKEFLEIRKENP